MKLVSFVQADNPSALGLVVEGGILPVRESAALLNIADLPINLEAVFQFGETSLRALIEAAHSSDKFKPLLRSEGEITFAPCVPRPQKIICVGKNYRAHAQEMGGDLPDSPTLFAKFSNTLAGHRQVIPLPSTSQQVDYEAELAVVIGKRARQVRTADALSHVFGYCNANDVTARDLQKRTSQWLLGKSPDGFLPLGPWLVTADEMGDPHKLDIACWVNGERRQSASTGDMVFSIPFLISYISQTITLEAGDVLLTGTPAGVIAGQATPRWLQAGDSVRVEVQGLGHLENLFSAPV
jgi:2-keto-4-pentenoate hydratase/2-oxohepta-3-ene-1,7-dioic acid hydratase in catechol pathway